MEKYIAILKKSAIFYGINETDILSLLYCIDAKVIKYKKGTVILHQGDYLEDIAILLEGSLYIQSDDYWGNRSILGHISAGEIFGEAYALSKGEFLINDVVAIEDCSIIYLNAKKMLSTCASTCYFHTEVIKNMFFIISEKNRKLVQKLSHVTKRTTREKLISYLSEEAKKQNNSTITIPFNRQQLADFLSVDRSAMSNELCKMRDEGLLVFHKNTFKLL